MSDIAIITPCRLASTRFPRKLLHEIEGKPLVLWTAERIAAEAPDLPLYFAVGDEELATVLKSKGYSAVLTPADLPSGTDRIAVANESIKARIVVNIQADEPLVSAAQIQMLIDSMRKGVDMATLATRFKSRGDFRSSSNVKVVLDSHGRALYFSRGAIPYARDRKGVVSAKWLADHPCYHHLGMYAYTAEFLQQFRDLSPGYLEEIEKLEQLRALEHGFSIGVGVTSDPTLGIDTREEAENFAKALRRGFL